MGKFHTGLRRMCAVLVGAVFFVAGMLKLMDPVGAGLVVAEYLRFLHLGFMLGAAKFLGVALALLETLLGAALVAGVWRKVVAVASFAVLGGFTLLTAVLVIFNPSMDCGCFGEAVHLTHTQSLVKNLVMLVLLLVAFVPLVDGYGPRKPKYIGFGVAVAMVLFFAAYGLTHLPLVDFTDFAPGTEVLRPWEENHTSRDAFVPAPVLSLSDRFGGQADEVAAQGNVLMLSVYDPSRVDASFWASAEALMSEAFMNGTGFVLAAPSVEDIPLALGEFAYAADRKTLLTLNRSNGGATLLEDGMLVHKWHARKLPDASALEHVLSGEPHENASTEVSRGRVAFQATVLAPLALMLLI